MSDTATLSPLEMAEQVRAMVAGREGIVFADLFAADGVLEYPFAPPGMPNRLEGREAIRDYHSALAAGGRSTLHMDEVNLVAHQTTDPGIVVVEISHHGTSDILGGPYESLALGVIRVYDGEIVSYRDYMDPVALVRLFGRTADLVTALTADAA
jgi:uncharacterized protein